MLGNDERSVTIRKIMIFNTKQNTCPSSSYIVHNKCQYAVAGSVCFAGIPFSSIRHCCTQPSALFSLPHTAHRVNKI